jgi:ParB/RepB/Spo0J family partition protein
MMKDILHSLIDANPDQPRKDFDEGKLRELAQSITASGLMEPLVVTPRGKRFLLVAGERRWRACKMANVTKVPVRIIEADDKAVAELSLLENLQREDLNVIEIATQYQRLLDMGNTREQIAQKMGHSHAWLIDERLSLLNLQPALRDYTVKGILSPGQAFQLSRLPKEEQGGLFDKIAAGKVNGIDKLKALVNVMLNPREQQSFLPEPTEKERAINTKYDRMIDGLANLITQSFNADDLSVLTSILSPVAKANIEKIDQIVIHLTKIKRALLQADSRMEIMTQTSINERRTDNEEGNEEGEGGAYYGGSENQESQNGGPGDGEGTDLQGGSPCCYPDQSAQSPQEFRRTQIR